MGETKLGDIIDVTHGFAFKGEHFRDEPTGDLLLTPGNFRVGGGFQMGKEKYYSGPVPEDYVLPPGELVVTMTDLSKESDTLGYPALLPNVPGLRFLHNQRVGRVLIKDEAQVDRRFLFYAMCTDDYRNEVLASATGTGVKHTAPTRIEAFRFDLPPLPEQRAIARVLGGLDDKIELNRRMNRTLEDLARGLFRSWFVDFDPVTKNGSAKAPAAPHGLFPKRLVDSPLGPIPEGWRVGTVADLCTTQYGYTASATDDAVGPRMLRVTDMNKEPWVEWADVPHCRIDDDLLPRYALKLGDVLVSRMADPGKAAIVEEVLPEGAVFASYLIRLATRSIAASYYLFYYLRSDQYLDYAESVSGGTVQKNMNAQVITAAQMVIAPDAVADEFARLVRPWRAQIAANLQQSRQLAALRDALLPQLLSGEIRLREAELVVDDSLRPTSTPARGEGHPRPVARAAAGITKGRA